jgi:hypothetical protein
LLSPYNALNHVCYFKSLSRAGKGSKQDSRQQGTSTSGTNNSAAAAKDTGRKQAVLPTKKGVLSPRSRHNEIKYGTMGCKMHNEHGSIFCVAPLDGMPFLSSFSKDEKKKLHSSEILLLQQLELFTITSELMKMTNMNAPPQLVGIRCRNCIADQNGCCFIKISSVSSIPQDLRLMAREHVQRCPFLGPKDLKALEFHDGNKGRLADYCKWLAKLYSLEDSATGGFVDTGVVWGESPKLPAVYCYPADIDVSVCVQDSRTAPHYEYR